LRGEVAYNHSLDEKRGEEDAEEALNLLRPQRLQLCQPRPSVFVLFVLEKQVK
jgi:hypothetical protein